MRPAVQNVVFSSFHSWQNWMLRHLMGIFLLFSFAIIFLTSYQIGYMHGFIDYSFLALHPQNISDDLYAWTDRKSFGEQQSAMHVSTLEGLLYLTLNFLGFNIANTIMITKFLAFLVLPFLSYLALSSFHKYVLKKDSLSGHALWIISFLPFASIYFFNDEWHYVFGQRVAWAFGLLLLWAINRYIGQKPYAASILLAVSFLSNFAFNLAPFFIAFHFFIFAYILFLYSQKLLAFRKIVLFYGIYILLTAFSILSIVSFILNQNLADSSTLAYAKQLREYVSVNNNLYNLFRGISVLIWDSTLAWDPTRYVYSYQNWFQNTNFISFVLYVPILVVVALGTLVKNARGWFFVGLGLIALFIAKANNPPLGDIFNFVMDHSSVVNMFRSPGNKWMPIFLTCLSFACVLFFSTVSSRVKRVGLSMLFICYLALILIGSYAGVYSLSSFFILPSSYMELQEYLSGSESRVLFLPERDYAKRYKFGPNVNSLDFNLSHVTTFDIGQTLGDPANFALSQRLLDATNYFVAGSLAIDRSNYYQRGHIVESCGSPPLSDIENADRLLIKSKIDYVVFRKELIGTANPILISDCEMNTYNVLIKSLPSYKLALDNASFSVYKKEGKLSSEDWFNFAYTHSTSKINPTLYYLDLSNVESEASLDWVGSFSKGWHLTLLPLDFSRSEKAVDIFQETHANRDNVNTWIIDPREVRKLPKDIYWTSNYDGTINFKVRMQFDPQIYISRTFLLSASIFLILFLFSLLAPIVLSRRVSALADR